MEDCMTVIEILVGRIMPYITFIVFLWGIYFKIRQWNKAPQGKMTLYPASSTAGEKWKRIFKEILVFESLFKGNKVLWGGTWLFHATLALIIVGHSRVVTDFPLIWKALGMGTEDVNTFSHIVGGFAGVVILVMGIYLLFRRMSVQRVKEISDWEDYFMIGLILAIVVTGDIMRFVTHFDLAQSREYFTALVTFGRAAVPSDPAFLTHYFLGQLLVIYIPFSKFLHIPGVFYSKSILYQE